VDGQSPLLHTRGIAQRHSNVRSDIAALGDGTPFRSYESKTVTTDTHFPTLFAHAGTLMVNCALTFTMEHTLRDVLTNSLHPEPNCEEHDECLPLVYCVSECPSPPPAQRCLAWTLPHSSFKQRRTRRQREHLQTQQRKRDRHHCVAKIPRHIHPARTCEPSWCMSDRVPTLAP